MKDAVYLLVCAYRGLFSASSCGGTNGLRRGGRISASLPSPEKRCVVDGIRTKAGDERLGSWYPTLSPSARKHGAPTFCGRIKVGPSAVWRISSIPNYGLVKSGPPTGVHINTSRAIGGGHSASQARINPKSFRLYPATSPLIEAISSPGTLCAAAQTRAHPAHTNASPPEPQPSSARCNRPASR